MKNERGEETPEQEAAKVKLMQAIYGEKLPVVLAKPPEIKAKRVLFEELIEPGLLAVHMHSQPFTLEEISSLTRGMKEFALTADADWLHLEGSSQSSQSQK